MSEADKLFEELGYHIKTNDNNFLLYEDKEYCAICFFKNMKMFSKYNAIDENETLTISMQELKAINKKCEELGWYE